MSNNELFHYGVPGMKWGRRKAQPYAKRATRGHSGAGIYLNKKRQLDGDKKDLEYLNKGGHLSVGLTKKRQAAYDARDKRTLEKRIAKNEERIASKEASKKQLNRNIKNYEKKFNKANDASDKADAQWEEVKKLRQELGKTAITRTINAVKNTSPEAKRYSKAFDKADRMTDDADELWKEAKEAYKKTGRNRISRVVNNIRYGS